MIGFLFRIKMLNGLDLFSGIGGLTVALSEWVRPVAYCENDRYAQGVLLSRISSGDLPKAPIWDDVQTLKGKDLPRVDIIYGGFPCQDISNAGLRKGLEGKRSGLFFEIIRLVGELRPRFVFLENVAAITIRGLQRVVSELTALGYDCRWTILSASAVGANHQRERFWLLAYSNSDSNCREIERKLTEEKRISSQIRTKNCNARKFSGTGEVRISDKEYISDTNSTGLQTQGAKQQTTGAKQFSTDWWTTEPDVGRVANGIPFRVDRIRGLGNAVVPLQAREAFKKLMGI